MKSRRKAQARPTVWCAALLATIAMALPACSFDSNADPAIDTVDDGNASGSTAKQTVEGRYLACLDGCTNSHCRWDCGCRILEGKGQDTCDRENPYIDLRETPPPPKYLPVDEPPPASVK